MQEKAQRVSDLQLYSWSLTDPQCAAEDLEPGETEDEGNSLYTHLEAQSPTDC